MCRIYLILMSKTMSSKQKERICCEFKQESIIWKLCLVGTHFTLINGLPLTSVITILVQASGGSQSSKFSGSVCIVNITSAQITIVGLQSRMKGGKTYGVSSIKMSNCMPSFGPQSHSQTSSIVSFLQFLS